MDQQAKDLLDMDMHKLVSMRVQQLTDLVEKITREIDLLEKAKLKAEAQLKDAKNVREQTKPMKVTRA